MGKRAKRAESRGHARPSNISMLAGAGCSDYIPRNTAIYPNGHALMENVILIILLLLALALIGVVLLQRSEGGGLGMGGGGGGGGVMSGRAAASALSKVTWILGISFMACALLMTVLAGQNGSGSVVDQLAPAAESETAPAAADSLLPPTADETPTQRAD